MRDQLSTTQQRTQKDRTENREPPARVLATSSDTPAPRWVNLEPRSQTTDARHQRQQGKTCQICATALPLDTFLLQMPTLGGSGGLQVRQACAKTSAHGNEGGMRNRGTRCQVSVTRRADGHQARNVTILFGAMKAEERGASLPPPGSFIVQHAFGARCHDPRLPSGGPHLNPRASGGRCSLLLHRLR